MKTDAAFVADFDASHEAVMRVALYLRQIGKNVKVNVPALRPDAAQRFQFSDSGDIELIKRVEVKRRKVNFTGAHDFPFPTIFVNEKYKLDPETMLTVVTNAQVTHAALIPHSTKPHWVTESRFDEHQKRQCEFVSCPLEHVMFASLR